MDRGYQTDFWHHLARGRAIVEAGRIVDTDLFTFTVAGAPLRDANWLTQVLYYQLYRCGGLPLVQCINSITVAAAVALLVWLCRRASGSLGAAAVAAAVAFLGLWQQVLLVRPQNFSVLLFVALYAILHAAARRPRLLLAAPPLMALWANLHGGFPIGLVLIGAFLLAALWEHWGSRLLSRSSCQSAIRNPQSAIPLAGCFAASVLATLLNPYGWDVYRYVLTLSATAAGRGIEEWLPPGLAGWTGKVFAGSLVLLVVLFAASRRRPTARDVCLTVCFLPLACSSVRMVGWWMLATAPVVASMGFGIWARMSRLRLRGSVIVPPPRSRFAPAMTFASIAGVTLLSLPWLAAYNPIASALRADRRTESDLQAAVDQILATTATQPARIFSRLEWGEYLAWSASPSCRVFMDGRIEIYPDDVWAEYAAVTAGRADWDQILAGRGVDWLLLDAGYHGDLLPQVSRSPRWRQTTRCGQAVLFTRTREPTSPPRSAPLAQSGN